MLLVPMIHAILLAKQWCVRDWEDEAPAEPRMSMDSQ
jgi:hypothetical protein